MLVIIVNVQTSLFVEHFPNIDMFVRQINVVTEAYVLYKHQNIPRTRRNLGIRSASSPKYISLNKKV